MEPMVVMIMEKEQDTGFLTREIGSYTIQSNGNLIDKIYLIHEEGKDMVHITITTDKDVEDWEYAAILDYYNEEALTDVVLSFEEVEESYNPTWEVTFPFTDTQEGMEHSLNVLLHKHKEELLRVYGEIEDKKEDYL